PCTPMGRTRSARHAPSCSTAMLRGSRSGGRTTAAQLDRSEGIPRQERPRGANGSAPIYASRCEAARGRARYVADLSPSSADQESARLAVDRGAPAGDDPFARRSHGATLDVPGLRSLPDRIRSMRRFVIAAVLAAASGGFARAQEPWTLETLREQAVGFEDEGTLARLRQIAALVLAGE